MILSIIIPIYNVEKYIEGTLSSIYDQKVEETDFEVICVNDGTPDNSMSIVERFADIHPNLTIINQSNQGLSCARNAGMRIAVGEYLWFVDSDDKVSCDSLSNLFQDIRVFHTDILGYDIIRVYEKNNERINETIIHRNLIKYNKAILSKKKLRHVHIAPAQRFLFSSSFLKKEKILFSPGIFHEDVDFVIRAFAYAESILFRDYSPYHYLVRSSGNIMSSKSIKHVNDNFTIYGNILKYMNRFKGKKDTEQFLYEKLFYQLVNTIDPLYRENTNDEICQYINSILTTVRFASLKVFLQNICKVEMIKLSIKAFILFVSPYVYFKYVN